MSNAKKSKRKSKGNAEFKYQTNEKVLVLPKQAGEDIYEAKVLDFKLDKQKEPHYKIHYKGWNKRWDEWVNQRRLLKINASNMQIMSEKNNTNKLAQQQQRENTKQPQRNGHNNNLSSNDTESINSKSPSPNNSSTGGRKRKIRSSSSKNLSSKRRKLNNNSSSNNNNNNNKMDSDSSSDSDNNNDDDYDISQDRKRKKKRSPKARNNDNNNNNNNNTNNSTLTQISNHNPLEISLPTPLKRKLITDWENITKKHLLIELPRKKGERISCILSDFEAFSIEQGQDKNIVYEISRGIKDYFNQALQVTLLYKLEREQHRKIHDEYGQLSMDQIYGVEHLCRLFVKLPQLLSPNDLDNETRKILKDQIECIIAFCLDNQNKYFCAEYKSSNS